MPRLAASFADQVSSANQLLAQLVADLERDMHVVTTDQRLEICAAVWACVEATLEASALSPEDRDALAPTLLSALIPTWRRHCLEAPDPVAAVTHRAACYLSECNTTERFPTARRIADALLNALGDEKSASSDAFRRMSALLAHRMLVLLQPL